MVYLVKSAGKIQIMLLCHDQVPFGSFGLVQAGPSRKAVSRIIIERYEASCKIQDDLSGGS